MEMEMEMEICFHFTQGFLMYLALLWKSNFRIAQFGNHVLSILIVF